MKESLNKEKLDYYRDLAARKGKFELEPGDYTTDPSWQTVAGLLPYIDSLEEALERAKRQIQAQDTRILGQRRALRAQLKLITSDDLPRTFYRRTYVRLLPENERLKKELSQAEETLREILEEGNKHPRFGIGRDLIPCLSPEAEAAFDYFMSKPSAELEQKSRREFKKRDEAIVAELSERVQELAELPKDWDSYGARTVDEEAIKLGAEIALALSPRFGSPWLVPTADGGVQVEWHERGWDIEVCISKSEVALRKGK